MLDLSIDKSYIQIDLGHCFNSEMSETFQASYSTYKTAPPIDKRTFTLV